MSHRGLTLCLASLLASTSLRAFAQAPAPAAARVVSLPRGEAGIGFDDLRWSEALGRVLVPAGATGALQLLDPKTLALTAIEGVTAPGQWAGGHGEGTTSADEGGGRLFATDRSAKELVVIDAASRKVLARAKLAAEPDYVRWVAAARELWVTEPGAESIEVFRLEGEQPVRAGAIEVKGGPESLAVDGAHGRAYTHLWKGATQVLDVATRKPLARWENGCAGSRGIALDPALGLLFTGCSEGKATALDLATGTKRGEVKTGDGVDIVDYDPGRKHLYVPGGKSETLTIVAVSPKGELTSLATLPTAARAHCVVTDRAGHVFVCDPKKGRILVLEDPR